MQPSRDNHHSWDDSDDDASNYEFGSACRDNKSSQVTRASDIPHYAIKNDDDINDDGGDNRMIGIHERPAQSSSELHLNENVVPTMMPHSTASMQSIQSSSPPQKTAVVIKKRQVQVLVLRRSSTGGVRGDDDEYCGHQDGTNDNDDRDADNNNLQRQTGIRNSLRSHILPIPYYGMEYFRPCCFAPTPPYMFDTLKSVLLLRNGAKTYGKRMRS